MLLLCYEFSVIFLSLSLVKRCFLMCLQNLSGDIIYSKIPVPAEGVFHLALSSSSD